MSEHVLNTLQIRSDTIRRRLIDLYKNNFTSFYPSFDDSNYLRAEIDKLSTKLSEVVQMESLEGDKGNVSNDSDSDGNRSSSGSGNSKERERSLSNTTVSIAVFRDLLEMHDLLINFDELVESGNFITASASLSLMEPLLTRITTTARGITAMDVVKLQVSKKRARIHSRLSQLFAESFIVNAEEVSVTVKRVHPGVHGHVHYDNPVKISTLLHSMWYIDKSEKSSGDDQMVRVPVESILHSQLVAFASNLSKDILMIATTEANLSPESSQGTHWSKIQFVRNGGSSNGGGGSGGPILGTNSITSAMDVDKVLDRLLIILDFIEVELIPERIVEEEDNDEEEEEEKLHHRQTQRELGKAAIHIIGNVLWSPSGPLTKIVLNILRNALPENEKNMATFDRVIDAARRFESRLSSSGWLPNSSNEHFAAFVNDAGRQFIEKRRTAILVRTRDMLLQDYHNSVVISSSSSDTTNNKITSADSMDEQQTDSLVSPDGDGGLFSLPKMSVTRCAFRVVETLHDILTQATTGDVGEEHSMMLWQTARDIIELFRVVVPTAHRDHIATMPRIAMLFYCDCRYISHHAMVIAHMYRTSLPSPLNRSASMVDLAPTLRSDGAKAFVSQIKTQRSELMRMMVRVGDLSCLTDDAIGESAENAVSGILYHLNKLSKLWEDVLPAEVGVGMDEPTVYHRAMGALLGVVITEMVKRVDALLEKSGAMKKGNYHEMQHLLNILVSQAPSIFGENCQQPLESFVPSWKKLLKAAGSN